MSTKIAKQPRALMLGTLAIVVVIGSIAGGYYLGAKRTTSKNYSQAQQAINKPPEATPANTISPTAVIKKPQDYTGKEIKIYGLIISLPDNKYMIVGQEAKEPGAVALDFTDSKIDPKPYVANQSDSKAGTDAKPTNTVPSTVTGTLISDPNSGTKFTVKSIDR